MSLIDLSILHGRTLAEARVQLAETVAEMERRFGALSPHADWSDQRDHVVLVGTGFKIEASVDAQRVYVRGDIPLLAKLLGDKMIGGIKSLIEHDFQKRLK